MTNDEIKDLMVKAIQDGKFGTANATFVFGDNVQNKTEYHYHGQPTSYEDGSVPKSPKGAPIKYLFTINGKNKDIDTSTTEAAKFMHYLKDHKWDKNFITSKANDNLNIALRCFVEMWIKKKMINKPSPAAIVHFLEDDCNLKFEVDQGAFKSCMTQMLTQDCDQDVLYDVKDYFN